MRILDIHSKEFWFKATQPALKNVFESRLNEERKFENVMVCFVCVEKGDDVETARNAITAVKKHMENVKVNKLIIYPYAHLSSNLSTPSIAFTILKEMEDYAREKGIEVFRAPFGFYKEFMIHSYGHPLAELSKKF